MESKWIVDPKLFMKSVEDDVGKLSINLATKIFNGVVSLSPVRSGQFRASWKLTKDVIDTDVIFGGTVGSPLPAPSTPKIGKMTYKNKLYITNHHDYGVLLEYGASKQAPVGMVRITLAKLQK